MRSNGERDAVPRSPDQKHEATDHQNDDQESTDAATSGAPPATIILPHAIILSEGAIHCSVSPRLIHSNVPPVVVQRKLSAWSRSQIGVERLARGGIFRLDTWNIAGDLATIERCGIDMNRAIQRKRQRNRLPIAGKMIAASRVQRALVGQAAAVIVQRHGATQMILKRLQLAAIASEQ